MKNTHAVILSKSIVDGKVYWPVGISTLRAIELDKDPEESWKRFPHVDNKLQTDEEDICYQYMSYPTSESDDQSTQCETQERLDDDISQISPEFSPPRRERKRSASPDYIEPSPQKSPRRSLFTPKSRETSEVDESLRRSPRRPELLRASKRVSGAESIRRSPRNTSK